MESFLNFAADPLGYVSIIGSIFILAVNFLFQGAQ